MHRRAEDWTLTDFLNERWLPAIEATIRPTTFIGYRSHVRRHIGPALGELALCALDATTINSFYACLLSGEEATRGLSPNTVRRIHATLHRALRDAVRWGLLADNPVDRSDPPNAAIVAPLEMRTWDGDELRAFLTAVCEDELYALWVLLAMTGLRRGEALGLRWEDVDLDGSHIAIRRSIVVVGHDIRLSSPKTARGRRVVALDATTARVLRAQQPQQPSPTALVFAAPDGSPLHPAWVSRRFTALVRASGLPRIRLHDLRHTHATLALKAGVHPKIVSERLGHATVAITLDVYSHALGHLQAEAAAAVGELVWSPSLQSASNNG